MSQALLLLLAIAAGLMLAAGVAKLRSPAAAQQTLDAFGLPPRASLARGVGAGEASLGIACLLIPGHQVAAALLAVAYLALTVATGARWISGERQAPCGCFGDASAGTHLGHVAVNLACAAIATGAALAPVPAVSSILGHGLASVALVAGIASAVYLLVAILTLAPDAWRAYTVTPRDENA